MKKQISIKSLCVSSVLTALFVSLEWVATNTGILVFGDNYQIPISCLPLIVVALMYGPFWSFYAGLIGSFISQLLSPYGVSWSTLLWMIPTIFYSISVALLYLAFRKNNNRFILATEFFISSLILSFLNTAANYYYNIIAKLSNIILMSFLPVKIIIGIIFATIFAFIVPPIIERIQKIVKE